MPERLAKIGGWIALALCGVVLVRLVAIENLDAVVFLAPTLVGGLLAVFRPTSRGLLIVSAALMFANGSILFGGEGVLLIPSIVLVVIAAVRAKRPARVRVEHA